MKNTESKHFKLRCLNLSNYNHLMEVFRNDELVKKIIKTRREKEGFDTVGELAEIEGVDGDLMIKAARNFKINNKDLEYIPVNLSLDPEKASIVNSKLQVYVQPVDEIPDLTEDVTGKEVYAELIMHYH